MTYRSPVRARRSRVAGYRSWCRCWRLLLVPLVMAAECWQGGDAWIRSNSERYSQFSASASP